MTILVLVERRLRLKAALCLLSALAKELSLDCISYHRFVTLIYMLRIMIGTHVVRYCLQIDLSFYLLTLSSKIRKVRVIQAVSRRRPVYRIPDQHLLNEIDRLGRGLINDLCDVTLLEIWEISAHLHSHTVAFLPGRRWLA